MLVTINTDASFHGTYKVGAYAFWIVCDQGKILNSGIFKDKVTNSQEAEIKCIVNALHALYKSNFTGIKKVIINTDCLHFHSYQQKRNNRTLETKSFHQIQIKLIQKYDLKKGWIEVRHVKAHSGKNESRKWVNDWCDKAAKKMLGKKLNNK